MASSSPPISDPQLPLESSKNDSGKSIDGKAPEVSRGAAFPVAESRKELMNQLESAQADYNDLTVAPCPLALFSVLQIIKIFGDHYIAPGHRFWFNFVLIAVAGVIALVSCLYEFEFKAILIKPNPNTIVTAAEDWSDDNLEVVIKEYEDMVRFRDQLSMFLFGLFVGLFGVYWLQTFAEPYEIGMMAKNATMIGEL